MALIYRAMMMAASLVGGLFIGDLLVTAREHSKSGGLLEEVSVDINQTNIQMDGKE